MLKVIVFLGRREGMTREEFERHWREQHLPLVANARGYAGWSKPRAPQRGRLAASL